MTTNSENQNVKMIVNATIIALGGFLFSVITAAMMHFIEFFPPNYYNILVMTITYFAVVFYILSNGFVVRFEKSSDHKFVDYRAFIFVLIVFTGLHINSYSKTITMFYRSETIVQFIQQNTIASAIHYNLFSVTGFLLFLWSSYLLGILSRK